MNESTEILREPESALDSVVQALNRYLDRRGLQSGGLVVVAFSGGADSLALLKACANLRNQGRISVWAGHLDHALDGPSEIRSLNAETMAGELNVPFTGQRIEVRSLRIQPESLEATARRIRYQFLENLRIHLKAALVLTAHHREDQVETAMMRLARGANLLSLAAIRLDLANVGRPFLNLAGSLLSEAAHLDPPYPQEDPSNADLTYTRNRFRHRVLPYLRTLEPEIDRHTLNLTAAAQRAEQPLLAHLKHHIGIAGQAPEGARLDFQRFYSAENTLQSYALSALHRAAGLGYSPSAAAGAELRRQIREGKRILCSAGAGWRWQVRGPHLFLEKIPMSTPPFEYNLTVPGEVELQPIQRVLSLRHGPIEEWAFQAWDHRAALDLPLNCGDEVVIRNRRPGDRIQPLGSSFERKLGEVLIDAKIPREKRDQLPLLVVGGKIAWVPGVTIHERFRLSDRHSESWLAEIRVIDPKNAPESGGFLAKENIKGN